MIGIRFPAAMLRAFRIGSRAVFPALTALVLVPGSAAPAQTTTPAPPSNQTSGNAIQSGVLGEITSIDPASGQITLKLDSGQMLQVMLDDKTIFRRVAPGEPSLTNATRITLGDIGAGDRVYVQGKVGPDQTSLRTRQLIVMSKDTIAAKRERDSADWRRRGIAGVIIATNPEKKEITLRRSPGGAPDTIILAADKAKFHRYASNSAKFSDARPSTFEELKAGDVLRARGERSLDGTRFTTEELVSGSFQTVGGSITAIKAETGELLITDIQTRRPLTIVVTKDSVLRRMKPDDAIQFAPKKPGGPGGAASGGTGRSADFQEVLERQPVLSVADLKTGDMILISGSKGSNPLRLTAITLVAGMDAVLKQFQGTPPGPGGPAANTGLPMGIPLP